MSGTLDRVRRAMALALGALLLAAPAAGGVTLRPGDILVADDAWTNGNGAIIKIDPRTGEQAVVSSGGFFVDPQEVLLTPRGQLYVADGDASAGDDGAVVRVDPVTGSQALVSDQGFFENPVGIAREPSGKMVVIDRHAGSDDVVVRVDPATGAQAPVSADTNFDFPSGIAVDPSTGATFVTDEDATPSFRGGVIDVDPLSGDQTIVADNPNPADPIGFNDPSDVAFERATGKLLVMDEDANSETSGSDQRGSIFRVDPATGETTRVTTAGFFVNPTGVNVGNGGSIIATDQSAFPGEFVGAVFGVDPKSGEQELIAREGNLVNPIDLIMVPQRCKGRFATIQGTNRADTITGTPFADVIVTYRGRDRISAGGGNDIVCAGAGADVLGGAKGRDSLFGQTGPDKLFGGSGKDRLYGGKGRDLVRR